MTAKSKADALSGAWQLLFTSLTAPASLVLPGIPFGCFRVGPVQAFPVVKLRRTNIRIVHKVANTVGRVMTTGINIANKSSSSNALQSQDQPELDARYVYVGVHADGPTRVLCFGETRDEYTRGTNEESVALLTQRLKSLEERNRVRSLTFLASYGPAHIMRSQSKESFLHGLNSLARVFHGMFQKHCSCVRKLCRP